MCWKLQAVSSIKCDDSTWQRLASCRSMQKKKKKKWTVVEDEEGSGVMSGCQTWWWLRRGAGRYLESLPVGPNHSDSVLTPGLFLQSPQLPASLFGGWAGRDREREQMKREKVRGGGGRGGGGGTLFFFFFCLRSANITHTHTNTLHTSNLWPSWDCKSTALQRQTPENKYGTLRVISTFIRGASVTETDSRLF